MNIYCFSIYKLLSHILNDNISGVDLIQLMEIIFLQQILTGLLVCCFVRRKYRFALLVSSQILQGCQQRLGLFNTFTNLLLHYSTNDDIQSGNFQ